MITVVFLTGCNGGIYTNNATPITRPTNLIQLQQGNQQGVWKTGELAVKYHYQMTPETLKIFGTVHLVGGFANCCSSINRLVIRLVFLDSQETPIHSALFYTAANHHSVDWVPMKFDETFSIPPGTTAVSFDYDGELIGGSNGPGKLSIWYSPT